VTSTVAPAMSTARSSPSAKGGTVSKSRAGQPGSGLFL
jgi:hypothetical protein